MSTKVLRPQELLGERFRLPTTSSHHRRTLPANGSLAMRRKPHRKPSHKHDKSRSNAAAAAKKSTHRDAADRRRKDEVAKGGLVMGQVILLRRGDPLSSVASKIPKSPESLSSPPSKILKSSESTVTAPKNIRALPADIYAGTAFTASPSPRSLPQPTFFNRKDDGNSFEDGATRFLRRVLRLE